MNAILHFIKNLFCWELVVLWLIVAALFLLFFIDLKNDDEE